MSKSKIEWTDETLNVSTGCSKVSAGCKNCYAEREWVRLSANPKTVYFQRKFSDVLCHKERLLEPLRWRKPRKIFINSMSDLFLDEVPFVFIDRLFAVMALCPLHTFQILTKRPKRMLDYFKNHFSRHKVALIASEITEEKGEHGCDDSICGMTFPLPNVWLGVSVENQEAANERIPVLLEVPAAIRWVSVEPLLGEINLSEIHYTEGYGSSPCSACGGDVYIDALTGSSFCDDGCDGPVFNQLDWVVTGGESGPKARPIHPEWLRSIRNQCDESGTPFLFKQWGEFAPADQTEFTHAWCCDNKIMGGWINPDGTYALAGDAFRNNEDSTHIFKLGKSRADRLLDGVLHDQYPKGE